LLILSYLWTKLPSAKSSKPSKVKNNRTPGLDGIPAVVAFLQRFETWRSGGDAVAEKFTELYNAILQQEELHDEWRQGVILPLQTKGNLSDCNNWGDYTVLSTRQSILHSDPEPPEIRSRPLRLEGQAGFQGGKSCNEHLAMLR